MTMSKSNSFTFSFVRIPFGVNSSMGSVIKWTFGRVKAFEEGKFMMEHFYVTVVGPYRRVYSIKNSLNYGC